MTTSRRSLHRAALVLAAIVVFACFPAGAADSSPSGQKEKQPYALIFGTVWDKNQRPAYGVKVKIRRAEDKKARWEVISNHSGEFAQRVPAGKADYVIWADIKAPKGQPKPETKVHVEFDERVDVGLHLTE